MDYTPQNWYWIVGSDETKVWSSIKAAYVPATDPDYKAWCAVGGFAARVGSEGDVREALAHVYPQGAPGYVLVRTAAVGALLDALSPAQRAAIPQDDRARLLARGIDGPVGETSSKVVRAAKGAGLAPKAWFDAATAP